MVYHPPHTWGTNYLGVVYRGPFLLCFWDPFFDMFFHLQLGFACRGRNRQLKKIVPKEAFNAKKEKTKKNTVRPRWPRKKQTSHVKAKKQTNKITTKTNPGNQHASTGSPACPAVRCRSSACSEAHPTPAICKCPGAKVDEKGSI